MPILVRDLLQQQCNREDGPQRVSLSNDRHIGATVQHYALQRPVLQFMAHTKVPGDPPLLLLAPNRTAGRGQAAGLGHLAHLAVEGTSFLRAHR